MILKKLPLIALMAGIMVPETIMAQGLAIPATSPAPLPLPPVEQKRPNILVWMMDDVGFGQVSAFGGLVATPNIDRVARMGLLYSNYRTAPMCSPARAAFLSGRMPHSVHMGGHAANSFPAPGYDAKVPPEAGTLAENLRQAGYSTYAVGKWDHLPAAEMSPAGPFRHWPLGQGFERFYGFLAADTDNFEPTLVRDNAPVVRPQTPGYHLSADLADQAIEMIRSRDAARPERPFFLYWASGAAHAPHHAPQDWIARYKGRFDAGWDKAREQILRQQVKLGLIPKGTRLAPMPKGFAAWNSLSADQKRLNARQMEAFAASLSYADAQFGRILDVLAQRGELDNTIIIIASDNGTSAEGGPNGMLTEAYIGNETPVSLAENLAFIDQWGGAKTSPHYANGWAVAGNTPFRYFKRSAHEGGIHVPLVIAWPKGIAAHGEMRMQSVNVSDLAPTLLEAADVTPAAVVNNVPQSPMEGQSIKATFAANGSRREGRPQYYELWGNKSVWEDGWSIVTSHHLGSFSASMDVNKPFDDPWELYDLVNDPGQAKDLAARNPDRVRDMEKIWLDQASRFHVLPQHNVGEDAADQKARFMADLVARGGRWSYAGTVTNIPAALAPPINILPSRIVAKVDLPAFDATGPIFAYGGTLPGIALYLDHGIPVFLFNAINGERFRIAASEALPTGLAEIGVKLAKGRVDAANRADWTITLTVGAKIVGSDTIHIEMPRMMGVSATFDIGSDTGTPVLEGYPSGQQIAGRIEEVTFDFLAR